MENEQIKSSELYTELLKVLDKEMIDNHCSDLYCKVTPLTKAIINRYEYKKHVTTFRNNIDNELWYDIPFAYTPYFNERLNPMKTYLYKDFYGCYAIIKETLIGGFLLSITTSLGSQVLCKEYKTLKGAKIAMGRYGDCWQEVRG